MLINIHRLIVSDGQYSKLISRYYVAK